MTTTTATTTTGKTTGVAYNNRGLVSGMTDAKRQNTTFAYDARGRLTNRTDNAAATTYQYDFNNNCTAVLEHGLRVSGRLRARKRGCAERLT